MSEDYLTDYDDYLNNKSSLLNTRIGENTTVQDLLDIIANSGAYDFTGSISGKDTQDIADAFGTPADGTQSTVITDLINARLDTSAKEILGEFIFAGSGAIKMATDANNGLWLSPTGILGKKAGVTTFAVDTSGNATFGGTLSAGISITSPIITGGTIAIGSGNNIFKADSNGIYLGNATFASAPFRVSMAGAVTASNMTITGGSVTSAVIKSASTGNRLLILDSNFGDKTISWVDTNDILKAQVGYDFAGNLQILAPVIYLSTLTDGVKVQGNIFPSSQNSYDLGQAYPGGNNWRNAYFSGNIYIDGTVDGVDISAHAGNASAHHSSTSNGLNITPANVELSGHLKLLVTSTPPSSAVDGWMFYHDTYDEIWVFKGGAWKALAYVP